jgi:thioesterase domain-containing protein
MIQPLNRSWKKKVSLSYEELCCFQPDEQLAYLLDRLKEAQVVPEDTNVSQIRRYIQVYEEHDYCLRKYRPKPYPGSITLFRSEDREADPLLWSQFSSEPLEVHPVSGDHLSMVDEPHVKELALQLQQCLDKADVL